MISVYVSNRDRVERLISCLKGPVAIISITDPDEPTAFLGPYENRKDSVIRLQFHGLDKICPQLKTVTYFDDVMASQIVKFVHKNKHVNHIVVHCEAGVCRSPAIAAATCEHLGVYHEFFREYYPNTMVFSILRTAFGF